MWIEDELTALSLRDAMRLCVVMCIQAFEDVTSKSRSRVVRDNDSMRSYMRDSVASARLAWFQAKRVEDLLADALETFTKLHERSTKQRRDIADSFLQRTQDLFETLRLVWPKKLCTISDGGGDDDDDNDKTNKEKMDETSQRALWKRPRGFEGTSQKRGTYFGTYTPSNVRQEQNTTSESQSTRKTSTTNNKNNNVTKTIMKRLDFSTFEARQCEEMRSLEAQIDLIERHFIDGRMQINDAASNDFAKTLKLYCEEQYEKVTTLIQACINVAPVISRRVQKDREIRMNLLETKIEKISARLLATHASLTSLPVQVNASKKPVEDVERLLLETDKFAHILSHPLDLSAHHKFEHACSHISEKIARHCTNVKRRCEKYEKFLNDVLKRQKETKNKTKEIETRLISEWNKLKQSYAPLLPPLRIRKEFSALLRSLKVSLDCTSDETSREAMRLRHAKFKSFMTVMKRCKKSSTFLVRHLRSRMIKRNSVDNNVVVDCK